MPESKPFWYPELKRYLDDRGQSTRLKMDLQGWRDVFIIDGITIIGAGDSKDEVKENGAFVALARAAQLDRDVHLIVEPSQ